MQGYTQLHGKKKKIASQRQMELCDFESSLGYKVFALSQDYIVEILSTKQTITKKRSRKTKCC